MENIDVLKEAIIEISDREVANKKLLQAVIDEFVKKKLNNRIPNLVWREKVDWSMLTKDDYMAMASSIRYELGRQNKERIKDEKELERLSLENERLALDRYFTPAEIKDYRNTSIAKEEYLDTVELTNVVMLDSKNYHCIISAEELYKYRKNQLITFNPKYQRASRLITTRNGVTKRAENLNKKGVKELKERYLKGDIAPTSITLCVNYQNENALDKNFEFNPTLAPNIGNMIVRPDIRDELPEEESLEFNIPDGFHRYNGICDAYSEALKEGWHLDYKLGCFIHIMNPEEEVQYVADVFKRNETNAEYLKALEMTDENKFVNQFELDSKWLNNHVATTTKELKLSDKYVTKKTLIDSFAKTDITATTKLPKDNVAREKVAKVLDTVLDYIESELFEGNINNMKQSIYLNDKLFYGYIKFAANVRNERSYNLKMVDFIEYLNERREEIENDLNNGFDIRSTIEEALEYGC